MLKVPFVRTRSSLSSRLKSPTVTEEAGFRRWRSLHVFGIVPSPLPRNRLTVLPPKLATAASCLLSPLKSLIAKKTGVVPVAYSDVLNETGTLGW